MTRPRVVCGRLTEPKLKTDFLAYKYLEKGRRGVPTLSTQHRIKTFSYPIGIFKLSSENAIIGDRGILSNVLLLTITNLEL